MYKIEAASKEAGQSHARRLQRRQRDTQPIVTELAEWIEAHAAKEPPSTALGKALTYPRNQWQALLRPLEDGALELDNGDVERTMRGPAIFVSLCTLSLNDESEHQQDVGFVALCCFCLQLAHTIRSF